MSMVLALQEVQAREIALVTPYPDHINEKLTLHYHPAVRADDLPLRVRGMDSRHQASEIRL